VYEPSKWVETLIDIEEYGAWKYLAELYGPYSTIRPLEFLLTAHEIPWRLREGELEWGWKPGMPLATSRTTVEYDTPVLPIDVWNEARDRLAGDDSALLEWLAGYFSDDPARWDRP
jgi:hypothetical protein